MFVSYINQIYGLRQAPRTWFDGFSDALFEVGFKRSVSDTSMFMHYSPHDITILLLYVDDIVITSSCFISTVIDHLHAHFEVKDLGPLNYFLGIEVQRDDKNLYLSQTKYTLDLLKRANFLLAKPCSTPVATGTKLSQVDTTPLVPYYYSTRHHLCCQPSVPVHASTASNTLNYSQVDFTVS